MKMIRIVLCCGLILMVLSRLSAQQVKNYETEWKRVEDLVQKRNLPKSALDEVKKIYTMAKRDKQDAQIIKSLLYMMRLQQQTREDNLQLSIKEIEKEIAIQKEPAASILKNMLAGLYWQYFQGNRWQLYQRANTVNFKKDDIATWTVEDFHKKIAALYLSSLKDESLLQKTSLAPYDAIINKGNVRYLRPTLYDLLAHSALNYFSNNERDLKKPSYAFEIDQPQAFAPAVEFVKYSFATKDSLSLYHKAILIYQELLRFHLKDVKPEALIDADINRIQFAWQNATLENKDELYLQALQGIASKYKGNPVAAQAVFLIAQHYDQLAARYNPLADTSYRYERIKAIELLKNIVKDSSVKSEGWTNSYNLLQELQQSSFLFEVEKVNVPGEPFRSLVQYRNTNKLSFKILTATEQLKGYLRNMQDEKYWSTLRTAPAIRSWQQTLPATNDLQTHTVEVKVDALPIGEYILVASANDFSASGNSSLGAQIFYVSNISYIAQGNKFFVLNRQSGQPLPNASVELYNQVYDYNTSRYTKQKQGDYKTNKNGYFEVKKARQREDNGYLLNITYADDKLFLQDPNYNYYYEGDGLNKDRQTGIFFFTDRSIYRPGQTVYFKGIAIRKEKEETTAATDYSTTIFLRNANYQVVDSMKLTSNDFGSFNGKFTLSQNLLNGNFTLTDKEGRNSINFSVEEYKRPKFYVEFDKVKQSYKVGDTIRITGNAKAYAGNNVDNAKIVYRVVRQPRFIYYWSNWRIWPPQAAPMEIAHGELTTNDEGSFSISFPAIPDRKINRNLDPVFDYRIHVDITDIAGETRSGDATVTAGYKSLVLKLDLPERIATDSLQKLSVRTENMNGEFISSLLTVSFTRLVPEQRLIRKRYWQQPDQFVMTKDEFTRNFPHDEYINETDFKTWAKGETVFTKTDSATIRSSFNVGTKINPGFYQVQVSTKDREGNEIKDIRYVEVFDPRSDSLSRPEYLWTKASDPIEPGQRTNIIIGSSAPGIFLINQVDKLRDGRHDRNLQFGTLNHEKKSFEYTATEADRGGYGVSYFFIKDNRFYQFNDVIKVPWSNKDLKIEYVTFRDKTIPGSEEQWKMKISGYKTDKVAAEVLASMYDASLDAFRPHSWQKPSIWPVFTGFVQWNGMQNFASVQSYQRGKPVDYRSFNKEYDRFIFENNYYGPMQVRLSGKAAAMDAQAAPMAESVIVGDELQKREGTKTVQMPGMDTTTIPAINPAEVQVRKNLAETAFFFPAMRTDKDGVIEFAFTIPEALTRWKLQTLAHTRDLAFGLDKRETVTQKELMVQPNIPRFLRQGDKIYLSSKVANLSANAMKGLAELALFDATTNTPVDKQFGNLTPSQSFTIEPGQSVAVKFPLTVPSDFTGVLTVRILAKTTPANATQNSWTDGQESTLPVLTNRILVTETMPLPMRGSGTKTFSFEKLLRSGSSNTLQQHALTVEYTSNPAWFAVQAIPYLAEQQNETAEQIWNRYYAISLGTKIINAAPRIRQIFESWKTLDTAALLSNLQKNEELKSALLEETPWVLEAKSETEQKKNIALLFDMVRMRNELQSAFQKLKNYQSSNGGFVWVKGAPEDRYITQYIVTGIGHLKKLDAIGAGELDEMNSILNTAIPYLDRRIREDYDYLVKNKANLEIQQPDYIQVQYLYMRSFFPSIAIPSTIQTAYGYYRRRAYQTWMKQDNYRQGMIALALYRTKDLQTPYDILRSLKETSINNEEMGMYWKDLAFGRGWFWWQAPIETEALLIEAFAEITKDTKAVDDMRTWLIKNKQTNHWRTTKATAEAVYAFLLQGTEWLNETPDVQVKLGTTVISSADNRSEAGTGYFKQRIEGEKVNPAMGNITVTVSNASNQKPSWGAVYWQYFEDMDKVSSAATPLQLSKKLFIEKNTDRGPVLSPVNEGTTLNVGDKVKVRIELRVDREMDYVQMKDMRASAFEPVNVISSYKWQGGLGYYETTKDLSTSFFFPQLRRGTYVFEYPMFVTNSGSFSNGITTIQCFYAPEFSAHSEGVRVTVK